MNDLGADLPVVMIGAGPVGPAAFASAPAPTLLGGLGHKAAR